MRIDSPLQGFSRSFPVQQSIEWVGRSPQQPSRSAAVVQHCEPVRLGGCRNSQVGDTRASVSRRVAVLADVIR
jgi:hypothetical protein